MTRNDLIDRIKNLSEEELRRVGPYLAADLDALEDLDELKAEVARGRESARQEPLLDDEAVASQIERLLKSLR
jgi:hypothetical protein